MFEQTFTNYLQPVYVTVLGKLFQILESRPVSILQLGRKWLSNINQTYIYRVCDKKCKSKIFAEFLQTMTHRKRKQKCHYRFNYRLILWHHLLSTVSQSLLFSCFSITPLYYLCFHYHVLTYFNVDCMRVRAHIIISHPVNFQSLCSQRTSMSTQLCLLAT